MTVCNKAIASLNGIDAFYFSDPTKEMAQIMKKLKGLSNVLSKSENAYLKTSFKDIHNIKQGATTVNDLVFSMLGIDDWNKIKNLNDKQLIHAMNFQIDSMMETAIYAGVKPAAFSEDTMLISEFASQYKAIMAADATERWMMKLFSGEFIRKYLPESLRDNWDGLIVQKDKLFRRNKQVDTKRTRYRKVVNDVEVQVNGLMRKATEIFDKNRSPHLTADDSAKYLKYFDADIMEESKKTKDGNPYGLLMEALKEEKRLEGDALTESIDHMKRVYESWQELNYGVKGDIRIKPNDVEDDGSYYDPRDHQGTMLKYIHDIGDNLVDQLMKSEVDKNALDVTQKFFLEKFGNEETEARFGVKPNPLQIRAGYVPIGKNNELDQIITSVGDQPMFSTIDMFGSRKQRAEITDTDFRENFTNDMELLRHVASDVSLYTYAQDLRTHMAGKDYAAWRAEKGSEGSDMEDGMYRRYHEYVIKQFEGRTKRKKNQSKTFNTFKKLGLMTLGLQGTMGLSESALNNYIQGTIGALNIVSGEQYVDLAFNLGRAKNNPDKNIGIIADVVKKESEGKIKGRKASFVLTDVDANNQDQFLKAGFKLAEAAMSYGPLLPALTILKPLSKMLGKSTEPLKDRFYSMTGSEQILRNFNSKVLMNMVHAKYVAQKAAGTAPKTQKGLEEFVKNIMKDNQYYFDRFDQTMFGDFDKQTKPFWTYSLNSAEKYRDLFTGLAGAQFYMFRQAGMFGLLGSISQGLAKPFIAGGKGTKTSAITTIAPAIIGLDLIYEFASDMLMDDPIKLSALNAVNQLDLPLGALEWIHCQMAPMLGMNVTEQQFQNVTDKLIRFGAGMLKGNRLEDEDETLYKQSDLAGYFARAAHATVEPFRIIKDIAIDGVNPDNTKEFKDRIRNRATGVGMLDAIIGPGNDALRMILKSTYTAGTLFGSGTDTRSNKQMAYIRSKALANLFLGQVGLQPYVFSNKGGNLRRSNGLSFMAYKNTLSDMKAGHYGSDIKASNGGKMLSWADENDKPTNNFFIGD